MLICDKGILAPCHWMNRLKNLDFLKKNNWVLWEYCWIERMKTSWEQKKEEIESNSPELRWEGKLKRGQNVKIQEGTPLTNLTSVHGPYTTHKTKTKPQTELYSCPK